MRRSTILLTIPVVAIACLPLLVPGLGAGVLSELGAFGGPAAILAIGVFFALVAFYVRALQHLLATVPPPQQTRSVRSLWLMFAIPFNFVEDFVIVRDIASSVRVAGESHSVVASWRWLGWSWCALQILSLLPGEFGIAAGAAALIAWIAHWLMTVRFTRRRTATRLA